MRNNNLFKILLDVLCFFCLLWFLIPFIFMIKFGTFTSSEITVNIKSWTVFYWCVAVVGFLTYILFMRGLYFSRKVARILPEQYFLEINILLLKKVGRHFLLAGTLYVSIILIVWLEESINLNQFSIGTNMSLLPPLSLIIMGMFFSIQSNTLVLAKIIKEENELTV